MSLNIYIGDIHGRSVWKQIVEKHPNADNFVFVGDYVDSFDISGVEELVNLYEIISFAKSRENVHLLVGNHDLCYFPGITERSGLSGYQPNMYPAFFQVFSENLSLFKAAVSVGNNLCSHAGISEDFLKDTGYWTYKDLNIVDFVNDLFHHKINEFNFYGYENRHYGLADSNPYGDDPGQSPMWIRPKSLQRSNKNSDIKKEFIQIVGHTSQNQIDIQGKSTGGRYYYIDTLEVGQYLIEENGVFRVGYLEI